MIESAPGTATDATVAGGPAMFDVVIIGAGLSGIGAACRLKTLCPGTSFVLLEGRPASGGTWDLFRYPGIRSDSDMFTLGYPFNPWSDARSIADGPSILRYIRQTASEYGIDPHIRYGQKVISARWCSVDARWSLECEGGTTYGCRFLYMCSGYYSYDGGYTPTFPNADSFTGKVVHPQQWPEDIDYTDKRVVVIGSGATAVTLVPALAEKAAHVTMLQRSPSYVASLPAVDPVSAVMGRILPRPLNQRLSRWKNIVMSTGFYQFCRRRPAAARKMLASGVAGQLPSGYPVEVDFNPAYDPWDQRMCMVPDGDLFKAISSDKASIITGVIDRFTDSGIRLVDGRELPADIIVSATGLTLVACGGVSLQVDGVTVTPGETVMYRGCMLSDVPNFATCLGYTNASWTLRADLTSRYVCRVLNHMKKNGFTRATPRYREPVFEAAPLLDLTSGYVKRGSATLPKQGNAKPWRLRQNYLLDYVDFLRCDITESMEFARPFQ